MSDDPLAQFAAALAAFQTELPHIVKDQTANAGQYSYSYADLTDIAAKVLPLLASHGLSWTCGLVHLDNGALLLRSSLLHVGGHREVSDYPLPERANAQQMGSAITYGRRYTLTALTGVAPGGEDDDGARATEAPQRSAQPQQRPSEPVEPATDHAWFANWQERVKQVNTESRLVELWKEVAGKAREGQVHPEDMDVIASPLFRERHNELRQAKQEALT